MLNHFLYYQRDLIQHGHLLWLKKSAEIHNYLPVITKNKLAWVFNKIAANNSYPCLLYHVLTWTGNSLNIIKGQHLEW